MAKEMLNGSGVVIERAGFRHCTADATLKMVQASHHCAIAGVSASANAEGALRLRVVAASDSAEHEKQSRFEEFVSLLRSCYGVCSADLFNRPYFCTAYPISDLHCQARLYARADDVNKTFGNNTEQREKKLLQTDIEIEALKNDGIKGYKGPRWSKGFKKAQSFIVDTSIPASEISRLVVVISKSKEVGPVADDFLVVPFPEDLCKENMVLKYCWKLLLHTWWKNPKKKEVIPQWMKDRFVAVLDLFCLRQALKESNKMCDVCGEMVPLKEAFHHREKHKLDVRECCGIKLPSEKAARRHMNLYHNKNKYVRCEHCERPFSKPRLAGHVANCDKKKQDTVCPVCGELCTTLGMINNHLNNLHKVITCEICGEKVTGAKNYNSHKKRSHTGSWPCPVCGKVFKSQYHLRTHNIRSHARDDEKPHQCSICGRGFLSPHSLREHIMVVHEKLRPFKCRYECGMTMSCIGNRNKHEKNRHGAIFGKG